MYRDKQGPIAHASWPSVPTTVHGRGNAPPPPTHTHSPTPAPNPTYNHKHTARQYFTTSKNTCHGHTPTTQPHQQQTQFTSPTHAYTHARAHTRAHTRAQMCTHTLTQTHSSAHPSSAVDGVVVAVAERLGLARLCVVRSPPPQVRATRPQQRCHEHVATVGRNATDVHGVLGLVRQLRRTGRPRP